MSVTTSCTCHSWERPAQDHAPSCPAAPSPFGHSRPPPAEDSRAEAREQIAAWMARHFTDWDAMPEQNREAWRQDAERFITSCPVVAEGLAAQEALQRVEALGEEFLTVPGRSYGGLGVARRIRRALGGHP